MGEESRFGRVRHDTVSADQVKALMDDIDSSIASIDERLRAYEADPPSPAGGRHASNLPFPTIDLAAQRTLSEPHKTVARPPPEMTEAPSVRPPQDLLAELARCAEEHAQDSIVQSRSQQETEQRLDRVLRTVFDYLHQFTRHVNVIRPAIPLNYALDLRNRFGALQWHEGTVDYRTRSKSEAALIETVSVRVRYATEALEILQPAEKAKAMRDELHLLNLTIGDETNVVLPGRGCGVRFTLAGSIPVQLNFRSDLASGKIVVRGRNVSTLGLSAYLIDPDKLSRASLDAVGLNLLGRSGRLPGEFAPVAFSTKE
ncbi:MAG: hypothetical protein HY777_13740 [Betaproteobacteria bacterium]|nr:hypothetical protein [Betaproteobacteria bacterium]